MASHRRSLKPLALIGLLLTGGVTAPVRASTNPAVSSQQDVTKRIAVRWIEHSPVLDGRLDPQEWPADGVHADFLQLRPDRGAVSVWDPSFALASDGRSLYVAFRCPLPDGQPPLAAVTRRDDGALSSDDVVGIVLDTFRDGRTGYVFYANALGTQADVRVANDAETLDATWDAAWRIVTSVGPQAWTAEIEIPFRSLNWPAGVTSWGINLGRRCQGGLLETWWSGPVDKSFHVSRSGVLTDIPLPEPLSPLTLVPYLAVTGAGADYGRVEEGWHLETGADLEGDLGSAVTLNATLNPDFASVEGDREKINLTPFELSFPEKRRFFMEGNDLWSNRIQTFYTRRIGQIDGGAKVVGRSGRNTLAGLVVREAVLSDDPDTVTDEYRTGATWGVLRLRRDVLNNSTVGLLAVNRHSPSGETGALGSDLYLNLPGDWYVTGQAVLSWPDPGGDTGAWFLRMERKTDFYAYHLRYTELGERFRENVNTVGFIRDDDRRELDVSARRIWYPDRGLAKFFKYDSNYKIYWSRSDGSLRNWEIVQGADLYLHNEIGLEYEGRFEAQEPDALFDRHYFNRQHELALGYRTEEWASTALTYSWGRVYDSRLSLWEVEVNRVLIPRLTVSYTLEHLRLEPDPEEENTTLHVLRVDYAVTPDLFGRVFTQTNSEAERFYLYGLFGWRFAPPFGSLYVTYMRDRFRAGDGRQSRPVLFLKLGYPIGH